MAAADAWTPEAQSADRPDYMSWMGLATFDASSLTPSGGASEERRDDCRLRRTRLRS